MKKMIIYEEEKNRILGMHQDATKRHYLGEQQTANISYDMETLKMLKDKVNEYLSYNNKELLNTLNQIKTNEGVRIDIAQPFLSKNQDNLKKINPKGYEMATKTGWDQYESNLYKTTANGRKDVYIASLTDLIEMKQALNAKSQSVSGIANVNYPKWVNNPGGMELLDIIAKNAGIVA